MDRWLTPQDLAGMTGFSVSFIRSAIKNHELKATLVKPRGRRRGRWRIAAAAAQRYTTTLGFAPSAIAAR